MFSVSGNYQKGRGTSTSQTRVVMPKWGRAELKARLADTARLRGPNPYAGNDLGYDPATLALMPGGARDMAAGAVEGGREAIDDTYAAPGGPGMGSFAHKAALAGYQNAYAASVADASREAAVADAALRREDMRFRMGVGAENMNIARAFSQVRNRARQKQVNWGVSAAYGK